jgi:uncharacterized protein
VLSSLNSHPLIGVGLRHPHYHQVIKERPPIGWFEVHSENFFQAHVALDLLGEIRKDYPISLHGVGLSLGSADGIQKEHLIRTQSLMNKINPFLISEHLSWSRIGSVHMPDLLPLPYTEESLNIFCRNVEHAQEFLGRELLIENPSSYLEYKISCLSETEFLVTLCQKTGAKILLDVNNIYVSCTNHGWDAHKYIHSIPNNLVKEIHLAGHSRRSIADNHDLLIDTHNQRVCQPVWDLYKYAIQKYGSTPTLLEWDADIPDDINTLIEEASKALCYLHENA